MRDRAIIQVRQRLVDVVKPLNRPRHAVVIRRRRPFAREPEARLERRLVPDFEEEDAELEQRDLGLDAAGRGRPGPAKGAADKGAVEEDLSLRGRARADEEEDGVFGPGAVEPAGLEELQQAGGEAEGEQHAGFPGERGAFCLEDRLERDGVGGFFGERGGQRGVGGDGADGLVADERERDAAVGAAGFFDRGADAGDRGDGRLRGRRGPLRRKG